MKNKDTEVRENIRLNIIKKRKEKHMTQKELAEYVNLKKNSVASWEQGLSSPDIDTMVQLLDLFEMDFYDFTGIERKPDAET